MIWFRKKKLVRLHLEGTDGSVEGIFVGFWAAHYVLRSAKLIDAREQSYDLEGETTIPKSRVLFFQVIG